MYCIKEEWVRVRRLLPGHGEAGWPEVGAAAAILLYVLYRREWVRVRSYCRDTERPAGLRPAPAAAIVQYICTV